MTNLSFANFVISVLRANYITIILSILNKLYRLLSEIIKQSLLPCHLNKRPDLYLHKASIKQGLSLQPKLDCRSKSICRKFWSVL